MGMKNTCIGGLRAPSKKARGAVLYALLALALAAAPMLLLALGGCGQRQAAPALEPAGATGASVTADAGATDITSDPAPGGPAAQGEKLSVYASFYPMYDFAAKIGGDRADVTNMVPAGTEPHDWEPSAADIVGLENARVFVFNGAGMEHWAEDILDMLQSERLIAVEASHGVELMEGHHDDDHDGDGYDGGDGNGGAASDAEAIHENETGHEEESGHGQEEYDPHVWLSPRYAKLEMENIKNAFVQADPNGKDYYEANYSRYAAELDALDKEFSDALAPLANRDIVVAHQAFGYLCGAYGLNQIPIEGLSPDSEPDPARMAEIIDYAGEHGVKVIFFEELVSPKVAQAIAGAIGAETDVLSPIEGLSDEQAAAGADYFSVMRENLRAIVAALR
jgi:zinc transport system substrate-binding protein